MKEEVNNYEEEEVINEAEKEELKTRILSEGKDILNRSKKHLEKLTEARLKSAEENEESGSILND